MRISDYTDKKFLCSAKNKLVPSRHLDRWFFLWYCVQSPAIFGLRAVALSCRLIARTKEVRGIKENNGEKTGTDSTSVASIPDTVSDALSVSTTSMGVPPRFRPAPARLSQGSTFLDTEHSALEADIQKLATPPYSVDVRQYTKKQSREAPCGSRRWYTKERCQSRAGFCFWS